MTINEHDWGSTLVFCPRGYRIKIIDTVTDTCPCGAKRGEA